MSNINELLKTLKTYTELTAIDVYIPSLKREVKFKPLTAGQQKSFYNCLTDNVVFKTKFIILTYEIIRDNCLEDIVESLTITDRLAILLALRKNILGSSITLGKNLVAASIESCFGFAKTMTLVEPRTVKVKDFEISFMPPLAVEQYYIEKELRENASEASAPINKVVQDVIFTESIRIIDEITLVEGDQKAKFNFGDLPIKDRILLVEALPAEILFEIQKYIKEINDEQAALLRAQLTDGTLIVFDITSDFFLDS